jgi:casein kinase II subunit beta
MFDSESSSDGGWIQWFCDLEGHEFFVEVEIDYIKDTFNLYGLKERIPKFNEAMKMILSSDSPDSEDLNDQSFLEIYQSAMDLYGLIHARYIISPRGLTMMREKFVLGTFGSCQRILCDRQLVLPIGLSEELSTSRVKTYCPRC